MKFAIITHTKHMKNQDHWYAYGPYVREMNIWLAHVDSVAVVAPIVNDAPTAINLSYRHDKVDVKGIPAISVTSIFAALRALILSPIIVLRIYSAMRKADHIHLRCPGNIGLLGCLVQILFPKKPKTAKYAGNWDPEAKQPLSYRFQKWLLSNTFWTKNMKVMVYGKWPGQSRNIIPFFTASYSKTKIDKSIRKIFESPYRFLFVGGLTKGKRPKYALKLIKALREQGIACSIDFYGDGPQYFELETFIADHEWSDVRLFGPQTAQTVESAFRASHFLVLPSKSEGWPKVVAEAMFWGVIPIVTAISCVPWMLDNGKRGILLEMDLESDSRNLRTEIGDHKSLELKSNLAMQWSRKYTLDEFETNIKNLLNENTSAY